ncbi:MAG: pantoate--beta-alanine ligase [Ilumatobacteraceae bacterium]
MQVFDDPDRMRTWSWQQRSSGRTVAVVPTMGALHSGHLALVEHAFRAADRVIVTIFVNPLQFDRSADLAAYPRPIETDLNRCETAGVHAVYAPTAAAMYPPGFETHVEPGSLADRFEGAHRPGHFRGVATVVTKLLAATAPDIAVFGEKDFQQLAVLRRLVTDLDLGVHLIGVPTVREPDGLAMSSRNALLGPDDRAAATVIRTALDAAARSHADGEADVATLIGVARSVVETEPRARIEYLDLVDRRTLEPLVTIDRPAVFLAAVWLGAVRLIDNQSLGPA